MRTILFAILFILGGAGLANLPDSVATTKVDDRATGTAPEIEKQELAKGGGTRFYKRIRDLNERRGIQAEPQNDTTVV